MRHCCDSNELQDRPRATARPGRVYSRVTTTAAPWQLKARTRSLHQGGARARTAASMSFRVAQQEEEELLQIEDAPRGQPFRRQLRAPDSAATSVLYRLPVLPREIATTVTARDRPATQQLSQPQPQPQPPERAQGWRPHHLAVQDRLQPTRAAPAAPRSQPKVDDYFQEPDLMTDGYRDNEATTESHQCPLYQPVDAPTNNSAIALRGSDGENTGLFARRATNSHRNITRGGKRLLTALVCCSRRPAAAVQTGRRTVHP